MEGQSAGISTDREFEQRSISIAEPGVRHGQRGHRGKQQNDAARGLQVYEADERRNQPLHMAPTGSLQQAGHSKMLAISREDCRELLPYEKDRQ